MQAILLDNAEVFIPIMVRNTGDKLTKSEIFCLLEIATEVMRTAVEARRTAVEAKRSAAETRRFATKLRYSAAEIRSVKISKVSQAATGL